MHFGGVMSQYDPDAINRLIVEFMNLQEEWERDPDAFDPARLQELADKSAHAYNENAGPSFHSLAFDGVWHSAFHERFLACLLQAGFDPFKLVHPGTGAAVAPVIDHADLAEAALSNPSSARMHAALMELATAQFASLADDIQSGKAADPSLWLGMVEACAASIPRDLLERISPELVREHHGEVRRDAVDPVEGYLSTAEVIADGNQPYG
jgi:hypothetical protein